MIWGCQQCRKKRYGKCQITFLADVVLECVAKKHESGFSDDKEKSPEVDNHQLGEGQDVYLDTKDKKRAKPLGQFLGSERMRPVQSHRSLQSFSPADKTRGGKHAPTAQHVLIYLLLAIFSCPQQLNR